MIHNNTAAMPKKIAFFLLLIMSMAASAEEITFSGDNMMGRAGDQGTTVLQGNASLETESMSLKSDAIELSGKDFTHICATGLVTGESTKNKFSFSADKLIYNRTTKVSEFFGNVKFIDKKNDATILADYALYNETTEILILKFNVDITQKDKHCKAMLATYNRKTQIVDLAGKPQITSKKDTFNAQRISINLDTEEINLQGKVSGNLIEEEKEKEKEKKK